MPPGARTRRRASLAVLAAGAAAAAGFETATGALSLVGSVPSRRAFSRAVRAARSRLSASICSRTRRFASACRRVRCCAVKGQVRRSRLPWPRPCASRPP
ncbi:hypothetical protein FA09DRAFT_67343 [Tilletiopsis washingtonensis]|uniref:Uncharacterized protein n=1 Tax=Tilletiopsis washingtonensis TaxID=58919 RepID=A0A316Z6U4_9BASI|nr:hypothetical protein FA09DRAFT_67343 [Tilletiopsis washingtonensis]PWN96784.1 hypothetical protein FA09DRAFT_67343 [Tilletiopsis washingtonensis]